METLASDLNPVAVLINKAMVEIPPRFANLPPVHPEAKTKRVSWSRAEGLAADIKAYGRWMRDEAERKIGHLYPKVKSSGGEMLVPIAWIWARTVNSPDPSWNAPVPLTGSWLLRKRQGKPLIWIEPMIDQAKKQISYIIREGGEATEDVTIKGGIGSCIATGATIPSEYIRDEARSGRIGTHLLATVALDNKTKAYLPPSEEQKVEVNLDLIDDYPSIPLSGKARSSVSRYGIDETYQMFLPRQLAALTTFSELLIEVRKLILEDSIRAGLSADETRLKDAGQGAEAYADAVVTYLAFVIDRCADYWSVSCLWSNSDEKICHTFGRQAIAMGWDFVEANPFSDSTGNWMGQVAWVEKVLERFPNGDSAQVSQDDARSSVGRMGNILLSTDPPYYDNICYADISDFFYVWLRHNLKEIWPEELLTLQTPKNDEMIANPFRNSKEVAKKHFEDGMSEFMSAVNISQCAVAPATIYYGYKATESSDDGKVRSTGWDTFLQSVVDAGLQVTATWPMRTERGNRLNALKANSLASSIVLVCRPRRFDSQPVTREEFIGGLREELPNAVSLLQQGNIAPVDLPQSAIGPGIKIFSRYSKVIDSDGTTMRVSEALAIINDVLDEILFGEESEFDPETRFALVWYGQYRFKDGLFGDADSIARAKNTAVQGVVEAGVGVSSAGKFRLVSRAELDPNWDPISDDRLTVWEAMQHLIATLEKSETDAEELLGKLGSYATQVRQLAYLLYKVANDNGWSEEATVYNGLIATWSSLRPVASSKSVQQQLI